MMEFNTTPKDAPAFYTDKAHYIRTDTITRKIGNDQVTTTRFYIFSIGRSIKNYRIKDAPFDNNAHQLLEKTRDNMDRLVLKGTVEPTKYGVTVFLSLTHFGIYYKPQRGDVQIYNPETGENGFYKLIAG